MEQEVNYANAIAYLKSKLTPSALREINKVLTFSFKDTGEVYILNGSDQAESGWLQGTAQDHHLNSDLEVTITTDDFAKLVFGKLNPMAGMVSGRMKLKGSMKEALKLEKLLKGGH